MKPGKSLLASVFGQPFSFALFIALTVASSPLIAQQNEETLDNAAVVKMVQAHLTTDVILGQIRNNPCNFILTTDSVIKLKQQGVPDKIITAMQEKKRETAASSQQSQTKPSAAPPPDIVTDNSWKFIELKDLLTKDVGYVIGENLHGSPGGDFQVVMVCKDDTALEMRVRNLDANRPLSKSCQNSRIQVGTKVIPRDSLPCLLDENGADLFFKFIGNAAPVMKKQTDQTVAVLNAITPGGDKPENSQAKNIVGIFGLFYEFLGQMVAQEMPGVLSVMGAPLMTDLTSASVLHIEIPFADSKTSIISFSPQDPTVKTYIASCTPGHPCLPQSRSNAL